MSSAKETSSCDPAAEDPAAHGSKPTRRVSEDSLGGANEASQLLGKDEAGRGRLLAGLGLAVVFSTSTTLSIPCLQLLGPASVHPLELLFFGFVAHLACAVPVWGLYWSQLLSLEWREALWLGLAGVANGLSTAAFYVSAESLPSGVVGAVGQGSLLLLSVAVTAALDRRVGSLLVVSTAVCGVGLILYLTSTLYYDPVSVKPPPGFNSSEDPLLLSPDLRQLRSAPALSKFHPSVSYIVLLVSALFMLTGNLIIHRKFAKVSFSKLLLFFPVIGVCIAAVLMFSFTSPSWRLQLNTPSKYLPFTGFLILFVISSVSLYACWMRTPAPIFSLITSSGIALLILIQYLVPVPGIQSGHPDVLEILGAVLILLANVIGPLDELQMNPLHRCCHEPGTPK